MKRSLVAVAALLAAAPATAAETLAISGYWKAFRTISTDNKPTCGMRSDLGAQAGLLIKYYLGDSYLTGQVIKSSWRFPATGSIEIPLTIGVDRNPILSGNGYGYLNKNGETQTPILEFTIPTVKVNIDSFLLEFAKASKFWMRFDQGTEQPWVFDMTGSAKVALAFRDCVLQLIANDRGGTATQPYGKPQATQPYGAPTQPYGKNTPTQPVQKQVPVKRGDDGSV